MNEEYKLNKEWLDLLLEHKNNANITFNLSNNDTRILLTYIEFLQQENQQLKKQLEYLRSGEYLNQLKFEINMLENIVQNCEVSKEDKEFIDMTHRNTELLEENEQLKEKYLNAVADYEYEKSKNQRAIEYIRKSDALYEFKVDTSVNAIPNSIIVDDYKTRKELIETLQTLKVLDEYKDES